MSEVAEGVQTGKEKHKSCPQILQRIYWSLLLQRPIDQSLKYIYNLM